LQTITETLLKTSNAEKALIVLDQFMDIPDSYHLSPQQTRIYEIMATWAGSLARQGLAYVVFVSRGTSSSSTNPIFAQGMTCESIF
jgi:hypothetical protein